MITHILFDFFGTLVNYSQRTDLGWEPTLRFLSASGIHLEYEESLQLWQTSWDVREAEAKETTREFSMFDVVGDFLDRATDEAFSESFVTEFIDLYLSEWNKGVDYRSGLGVMLGRLSDRFELAIITNTHHPRLVPDHLDRMGISRFFSTVVTSVEHGFRKPNFAIFRDTLDALSVGPDASVYVGDSFEADYEGARAAGIRALLIDPAQEHLIPTSERLSSILDLENRL